MSMNNKFRDQDDLTAFAREFLINKMNSLGKDVTHCLNEPYAPMPAILWCLSCIDLLGALLAGQASKKVPTSRPGKYRNVDTSKNSGNYMRLYMNYTQDQT